MSEVAQLCPTLCNPIDCSLPGSSIHGVFQVRVLDWVTISFSRGFPNPEIKPRSPALQVDSLPCEPAGKPLSKGLSIRFPAQVGEAASKLVKLFAYCLNSNQPTPPSFLSEQSHYLFFANSGLYLPFSRLQLGSTASRSWH